ncbi:restriction endonuclease subunit S [Vibrio diabolicus]|uniref:restriction endonuclease subunit S n=1 Tax=Vibrio TaxID=662 RepID=UPI001481FFE3|nr:MULTISPECIES: restriction endonuclease subunit S [Vibrio]MCS0327266.1 restriction endonuclease subunit S [Vibrio diabolicus]NNN55700.1 type I restriction endonuclease subunit S [Vibrio sp. 1-2 (7-a)]
MSELPKGWMQTSLGELCTKLTDGSHNPPKAKATGLPMLSAKNIQNGKLDFGLGSRLITEEEFVAEDKRTRISKGDVLLTIVGALGRSAIVSTHEKFTLQRSVAVLSAPIISSDYLKYAIESPSFQKQIFDNAKGTAQKGIYLKKLRELNMVLPPLAEQKRIVEKLDEVLAQVDTIKARLDGIPDLLKRFRQSVLFNATSGAISKNWRELNSPLPTCKDEVVKKVFIEWCKSKEAEFLRKGKLQKNEKWKEKFPTPDFGEVAVSCWNAINLSSVAEVIDPNPSHRMPKYIDDGLPFISSENIVSLSCIDFVKGKKIQEEELVKQKTRYEVRDGTFAFTRIGTIGKSVLLPLPHSYGISHAMAVVNPFQSLMDSRFLILAMNCKSILSQAHEGVQSVGVPDLGIGKMKSFIIPLPSIEEQKEIVRLVDQYFAFADTIEAQVKKAQARVDNLTQSILAKAFRGELVPQNDDDESAEMLLKRIAQARKEADALAKAAKKAGKKKS